MLRHSFATLEGSNLLWHIVGPPWKEGEIRLWVDKCFENISLNKCGFFFIRKGKTKDKFCVFLGVHPTEVVLILAFQ